MENINDRVKILRKELGLTLEKFGEKLGVGKTAISKIEHGERGVTDQMIKSICREFNVDYIWLTTGEGEMFKDSDDAFLERIDRIMAGENEFAKNVFKEFTKLEPSEWELLEKIIKNIASEKEDVE